MCSSNYQTVLWRDIRSLLHWKQVLRTNAASSAKQLSAPLLCKSAALIREHILPAYLRTSSFFLSFFHFSFFSCLYYCTIFYMSPFFCARPFCACSPAGAIKQGEHFSNFSVFLNDKVNVDARFTFKSCSLFLLRQSFIHFFFREQAAAAVDVNSRATGAFEGNAKSSQVLTPQ
jgi:hypothetical protein